MKKGSVFLRLVLFWLILVCLWGQSVFAIEEGKVHLSLISESTTVGDGEPLLLGLRANIVPGWKTYWRSPGGSGYGLTLNWEGSKNIHSPEILWPFPHRSYTQLGQINDYEGEVIFPLVVKVTNPSQPVHISVSVDMLLCSKENCLPVMQTLTLSIPGGKKSQSLERVALQEAMAKVPQRVVLGRKILGNLHIKSVEVQEEGSLPPAVHIDLSKLNGTFSQEELPELFLEIKDKVVDAPHVSLSRNKKIAHYSASIYPDAARKPTYIPDLIGKPITLTIGYQGEKFEVDHLLKTATLGVGFWAMMLCIAFIGGLILNIMPCVLPVLSLKVLSVMRHGGGHNATVRQEFLATVCGILFSFVLLAGSAIFLKMSGRAVGWGIQFQDPYFLIGLVGILTLFACNLFGFFEFRLPAFFSLLGRVSPHRQSLFGSFLEGSLVTALATPCTAPFLGTALAFALSRGSFEILSIFMAMGMGLASPFLLIAFFPHVATKLPKPGAWMVTVKQSLGALIVLTTLWLVYVLIADIGQIGASLVAVLMLLISLFLKKGRNGSESRKKMAWLGAAFLITTSFTLPTFMVSTPSGCLSKDKGVWHSFQPDHISNYVREGKVVFVSVTADWCLTCQANKYFVLKNKTVLKELQNENVIAMEADWTNHDSRVTSYLKGFNQYGIPFYAIYGCRNPQGKFLGQLLTPAAVAKAIGEEKCPVKVREQE